jgi:hypothetical protein
MNHDVIMFFVKLFVSAGFIAGVSTLAERNPVLAGYITALPLSSLLVLSFTYVQTGSGEQAAKYGLAIFAAIPASLLFFVPFLFYNKLKGPFWFYLVAGIVLLYAGWFIQRAIAARWIH